MANKLFPLRDGTVFYSIHGFYTGIWIIFNQTE